MGLAEWFRDFNAELVVKNSDTISFRYKALTRRLNTDFWDTTSETSHSLYVGSYGRNTGINGISDLDMIFELPSEIFARYDDYRWNGQSALLQKVKESIEKTYSKTNIRGDGQVVQIPFTDGVIFELVPAFLQSNGSYKFPDANDGGSWRTTSPREEIAAIRERNIACNNNLVPLCRMMRAWKAYCDVDMGGLLIDTLAYQFIETWSNRDKSYLYYDFMCRDFFEFMANQDREKTYWRAPGSGEYVFKRGSFQSKARSAHKLAVEAIEHETADPKREYSAKRRWRDIFGTSFPD